MKVRNFIVLFVISFLFVNTLSAQTDLERKIITQHYDVEKLNTMSVVFSEIYRLEKQRAIEYALENDIEIILEKENGGISILQSILEDGTPIYFTTFNAGSANTINTNDVYQGGANGLSLSGKGITFGIWDGGIVRASHQELSGRVAQQDNPNNLSSHATHVSGTMIATGIDSDAKGMSFEGSLIAYDFNNDISEMTTQAANGMLVSNHSYGLSPNQIPLEWFGAYLNNAANIDLLTYNAPNYLPVFAAGNSNNALPPYNPTKNGYDLISGSNLAKNILCVANVEQVDNYVDASSVNIWGNSSWGPTDDGRIKPDISAKGRQTYSTDSDADDSYTFKTGTSMAAPAVSGSIGLLHEHHNNLYNNFLSASSMKALVIHSAREAGNHPGPDYIYGWGLMDTSVAADLITNKNFTTTIEENTLNEGETHTLTVNAIDPNTPLVATLVWTDPAGPIQDTSTADDPTPRLVNDLDLKIIAPDALTEFLPWTLSVTNPSAAATKADNTVDNVEKVEIENALGQYTIEISHKGNLQDLFQNYSLVVSGIAESDFAITTEKAYKSYCGNEQAMFDLNINSIDSFTGSITLSQSGLPPELSPSFSNNTINNQGQSLLSINNLSAVPFGEYPFTVTATSGALSYSFNLTLNILEVNPLDDITSVFSSPFSWDWIELNPVFTWDAINNAEFYELELATTSDFSNIIFSAVTQNTAIQSPELSQLTDYYVRVRPINECVTGQYFTFNFMTKDSECQPIVFATDTPIVIPDDAESSLQSIINIDDDTAIPLNDINVTVDVTHSSIQDLNISLTSPSGTTITLFDNQCNGYESLNVIFDDGGSDVSCNDMSNPNLTGTVKPLDNLFSFVNENFDGNWTLTVEDSNPNNGGTINEFAIEICYSTMLSTENQLLEDFSIFPNPAHNFVNISVPDSIIDLKRVEIYDITGKLVMLENTFENTNDIHLSLDSLNPGTYLLKLQSESLSSVKKLILK